MGCRAEPVTWWRCREEGRRGEMVLLLQQAVCWSSPQGWAAFRVCFFELHVVEIYWSLWGV